LFPVLVIGALAIAGGGLVGGALFIGGAGTATATPQPLVTTQAVAQVTTAPTDTPEPTATIAATSTPVPPTDTPTTEPPTLTIIPTPIVAGTPVGGATGRLAFISNRDGRRFQIYTMNADGSDIQQLTTDDTDKWSPDWQLGRLGRLNGMQLAWSPDGTKLLYVARPQPDADLDVWVINADGSNEQNLTPSRPGFVSGDEIQPAWCNDGTIAFTSTRINNTPQIFIMRLEDRTPRNFSATRASPIEFGAQFFSDCRRVLLITTQNGDSEIWRMFPFRNVLDQMWGTFPPKDQTSYRVFLSDLGSGARAQEISISPDDQFVLYTRTKVSDGSSEIVVTTVSDSQNTMQISTLTNTKSNTQPAWSPDSKWITFVSKRDSPNQQIFRMRFNGAEQTNLTNDPDHIYVNPVWQPAPKP
jgi:Tol biopolymer transport system component